MTIQNWIAFAAAAVVLYKTLHHIACLSHKAWAGRRLEFTILSLSHSLMCAGAVGAAFDLQIGAFMLLIGMAGVQIIDRRNRPR
jgi:hypothetical protein